jgi:large subunit ribosomal protein L29
MIDFKEVKTMDEVSLERKVNQVKEDLFKLRMQKATSGADKPHLLKEYKRDIAKLLTAKNQNKNKKA